MQFQIVLNWLKRFAPEILFVAFAFLVFFLRSKIVGSVPGILLWDEGWYASIINEGYVYTGDVGEQNNVVFFPLYPFLCIVLKRLLPFLSSEISMMIISNLFAYISIKMFFVIVKYFYNYKTALLSTLFWLCFPFSFFLFLGFTESLFFSLVFLFFYFLEIKKMPFIALLIIVLASLTRLYGILLILVYLYSILIGTDTKTKIYGLVITPIASIGICLLCLYQYVQFGDPLLFLHNQLAWGHQSINGVINFLKFKDILFYAFQFELDRPNCLTGMIFLLNGFILISSFKLVRKLFFVFYIVFFLFFFWIFVPYSMKSMGRYLTVLFPLYLSLVLILTDYNSVEITYKDIRFLFICLILLGINIHLMELFFGNLIFVG